MNKVKLLAHYLELFILSILILLFTLLITLKFTLLNEEFVMSKFNDKHYEEVENFLKKEMKNSMISSGIDNTVIDNMFDKEDIKDTTKQTLDILYKDYTKALDVSKIENKLKENIHENLAEKNFETSDEKGLKSFVDSIMTIYKSEFYMFDKLSTIGKIITRVSTIVDIVLIVLGILIVLELLIRIKKLPKKLPVPLFTSSFLLLFGTIYIYEKAGIANFTIISLPFSKIIRELISSTFHIYQVIAIIFIMVGILLSLFYKKKVELK